MNTHPFIKFPINIEKYLDILGPRLEGVEKLITAISDGGMTRANYAMFQTWGVMGSLAIEGNPLTHIEIYDLITTKTFAREGEYYHRQVTNMMACLLIARRDKELSNLDTVGFLNKAHALMMANIGDTFASYASIGEIRELNVGVGHYSCPRHEEVLGIMEKFCRWMADDPGDMKLGILKAIAAHVMFACIHPYGDGNGRMSRWIEVLLLIRAGVPEPCAHMLSSHYWDTQQEYYRMLDLTHGLKIDGHYNINLELDAFMVYALVGFHDFLVMQWQTLHAKTEVH